MEKVINLIKIIWVHLMAVAFVVLSTQIIQAQEMSVVQVKRNITLADDEPVFKDYYINAGDNSALRKNMVVNVKRKITVKENGSKSVGDFETTVGQLKIIHIGNKVSVAREFKLIPRDEEPMLEQIGIMMGDRVDLTNSFIDYSKSNIKRKTTEVTPEKTEENSGNAPKPETAAVTPQAASAGTARLPSNTTPPTPSESIEDSKKLPALLQQVIPIPSKGL